MRRGAAFLCICILLGCSADPVSDMPVPTSAWGGPGVELSVTTTGATLRDLAGCFQVDIQQPLIMDRSGRFAADAIWVTFPLGSRPGIPSSARSFGFVSGRSMMLTVTVGDNSNVFPLTYGSPPTPPTRLC